MRVNDGYSSFLAKGHVPLFVLFLDVEPHRVDVNVHPAKREVRFADAEQVHQLVRSAVRHALGRAQVQASIAGSLPAQGSSHASSVVPAYREGGVVRWAENGIN